MAMDPNDFISVRLARQQHAFVLAFAVLVSVVIASFVYVARVNDVGQLRSAQYTACQQRNANVDAVQTSLLLLAQGEEAGTRARLEAAADELMKANCADLLRH